MIMPDVLLVENYSTLAALGLRDSRFLAIGLPYLASAFGIFLFLRQTFKMRAEGAGGRGAPRGGQPIAGAAWRVYVPLAKPGLCRLWARDR
jgi:sn-glycerol 3-phosphate transport system permease protein